MLKALEKFQMGTFPPEKFRTGFITKRFGQMRITSAVTMQSVFMNGFTCVDIEKSDERYMLCGGKNGCVAVYDLANTTGKLPYECKAVLKTRPEIIGGMHNIVMKAQWFPFDTGLFSTSHYREIVNIWDANYEKVIDQIKMPQYQIISHQMSSKVNSRNLIAIASSSPHVFLYDIKSGANCHQLRGHQVNVEEVAWSPTQEHLLVSGGADKRILLWDIRSARGCLSALDQDNSKYTNRFKKILPVAHYSLVRALKFTADGRQLVSQDRCLQVRLWDVAHRRNTNVTYLAPAHVAKEKQERPPKFVSMPFNLDICCDTIQPILFYPLKDLEVFDLYTGLHLRTFKELYSFVHCIAYRSTTQELYAATATSNIAIWSGFQEKRTTERHFTKKRVPKKQALKKQATNNLSRRKKGGNKSDLDDSESD